MFHFFLFFTHLKINILVVKMINTYRDIDKLKLNKYNDSKELKLESSMILDITTPKRYDEDIPVIKDVPYHNKLSLSDIKKYFEYMLDDPRIMNVNTNISDSYYICTCWLVCDYCNISKGRWMMRCTECKKHMCDLCYNERSEEDAIANGAKNWLKRKDSLMLCFSHEDKFEECDIDIPLRCDICNNESDKERKWYTNPRDDLDICYRCYINKDCEEKVRLLVDKNPDNWKHIDKDNPDYGTGSFLDWIPILQDVYTEAKLYYNINLDSKYYHKTMLSTVDNHCREGYFVCKENLDNMLEKIKLRSEEYGKEYGEKEDSWDKHYNCPINKILNNDYGHPVHYG